MVIQLICTINIVVVPREHFHDVTIVTIVLCDAVIILCVAVIVFVLFLVSMEATFSIWATAMATATFCDDVATYLSSSFSNSGCQIRNHTPKIYFLPICTV